jgi:hypothetical protein
MVPGEAMRKLEGFRWGADSSLAKFSACLWRLLRSSMEAGAEVRWVGFSRIIHSGLTHACPCHE